MGGGRGAGRGQRRDLARPRAPGAPARRRGLARRAPARRGAGPRRLPRPPGARPRGRRRDRPRAHGHARASQRDPSRRARAVRRHPAGLRRRALPLARRRRGAGDPAGDGVDARGGRDGARAPVAPALGGAVPPRVDLHRARRRAAAQLPRSHVRAATPVVARGAARRPDGGRPARAPPHAHGLARPRSRLRRALRRPRPRRLARQRARGAGARALLVHGRPRRPARPGRALRRRDRGAQRRSCGRARGAARERARLLRARADPPAGRRPRAAVRLHLRVRRLSRLRAQGRVRWHARAPLPAAGRRARLLRPADRVRPRRAPRPPARAGRCDGRRRRRGLAGGHRAPARRPRPRRRRPRRPWPGR